MNKLIGIVCAALFASASATAQKPGDKTVQGRLLVQARAGAAAGSVDQALARHGAGVEKHHGQIRVTVLRVPEGQADRIKDSLAGTGLFNFVERDGLARGSSVPNDPGFSSEWHLSKVQGPQAWDITTGASSVKIAIVDSGVDANHADLAGRVAAGWSFLSGNSNTADVLGHGTAVAGVAAASSNNATGVAGITWQNPIMPLVVLNSSDYASYSNIANAIIYAADHGARIINVSIGGSSSSSTLQSAVDYAWARGAVVFASAMNNSTSTPYYPAACDKVIAVSATTSTDGLASFSNFGTWIDLSAPGASIFTTMNGGGYGYWNGTSFASPLTAGIAALALSKNPALGAAALVSLLQQNSDDLGSAGFDSSFGWGRVNAYRAVVAAQNSLASDLTAPAVVISTPVSGASVSGPIPVQGSASDNAGVTRIELHIDGQFSSSTTVSPFSFPWDSRSVANGSHTLTVKAFDAAGNVGSSAVTVNVSNQAAPDTAPPSVTITSPYPGQFVSGVVRINVSASDNAAVSQVSIYIDGVLKYSSTSASSSYNWNTKKESPGSHTITAKAWDAAGNWSAATPVTVSK
ncbi:MAG: S8 family serine peptidase [Bryobacteraceae bacterium]